jgi:hypothetical protein
MFFQLQGECVYNIGFFFIEMLSATMTASLMFLYSSFCAHSSSCQAVTDTSEQTPICLEKLFIQKLHMYVAEDINHFQKRHTLNFVGSPSLKEMWIVISLHLRKERPNFLPEYTLAENNRNFTHIVILFFFSVKTYYVRTENVWAKFSGHIAETHISICVIVDL